MGYETTEADTVVRALESENGTLLAKLEDSPFYPEGGGQVSDDGMVATASGRARVTGVFRLGADQALALEPLEGEIAAGERGARRGRAGHAAWPPCATTPPPTCCTRRCASASATHVRQAGSYVGPDKLRFDFTHGERLSDEELADVEARVNGWIADNLPVRAIETSLDEARALGAMALFGEKYGDWVRMVEVEEVSRELCGGTHVRTTGEVGLFHVTTETSSASNVRRIEARDRRRRHGAVRGAHRAAARAVEADEGARGRAGDGGGAPGRAGEGAEEEAAPAASADDGRGGGPAGRARPRTWAARRSWPPAPRRPTRRRCSACPTACGRSSARPRWCWRSDAGGRLALVANVAPELVERGVKAATSCAPPPRWPAAAAGAATRWRRPAAATPRSSTRRWRPRAPTVP